MKARVGLVTVLFNSEDVLPGFFESLSAQKFSDYWLFILDNSLNDASYKKSLDLIEQYGLQNVTLIKNQKNVGVAAANNQGINLSLQMGCDYVLLLNNDIEFHDVNLFGDLVQLADDSNEKLIVPKIYFHDSRKIWCAGGSFSNLKGTVVHRGEGEIDSGQYDKDGYIGYAPTCFMLIHKQVFDAIGIMDEKYFVYSDDADFIWRANKFGFRTYYWAKGLVLHKVSSSTGGGLSPFSTYYCERNRIYFIRKNFSPFMKFFALAFYIITRPLKWRFFSKRLRPSFISGVVDGFKL
jgi:GT2 family glycosyltransferase